jgi:hypothetical protein
MDAEPLEKKLSPEEREILEKMIRAIKEKVLSLFELQRRPNGKTKETLLVITDEL